MKDNDIVPEPRDSARAIFHRLPQDGRAHLAHEAIVVPVRPLRGLQEPQMPPPQHGKGDDAAGPQRPAKAARKGELPTVSNRTFLEAVFIEALSHTIVASFLGDPNKVQRGAWLGRPWAPGESLPWGFDRGNTYLTVSTFEPDSETGECRRRKALFNALHAVMVDDVGYGMGSKVDRSKLALLPSALIETSPANYQAYYFLRQDGETRNRSICERTIDAMVRAGLTADGADPGMKGVTRYGRLPVGVNGKAKYIKKLGRPFTVRLDTFEPDRRYSLADIRAAWRLTLVPEPPPFEPREMSPELAEQAAGDFVALLELLKALGHLHEGMQGTWYPVTCPWVKNHTDRADTGTYLAPPGPGNNYYGGFRCHHGHCNGDGGHGPRRTMRDVWAWVSAIAAERASA